MSTKYIFSISTGRCGTQYLADVLSKAVGTRAVHESLPIMNGRPMQQFNGGCPDELRALMPAKLKAIQRLSANGKHVYCETNHSFVKGWGYLLPDTYIPQNEIGVIILRRDPEKVIRSLLRLHEVPGASEWTRTWYLDPSASGNLVPPPVGASPVDLCAWYVAETSRRAEDYRRRFPRITYLECDLEQLDDISFVEKMFETFGLTSAHDLKEAVGRTLNERGEWPRATQEDLLAPAAYPSADTLNPAERDALVRRMVLYLRQNTSEDPEFRKLNMMYAGWGVAYRSASAVVARAEPALERVFKYTLKFGETERILIGEFFRSVNPLYFLFGFLKRHRAPGVRYTYDLNRTRSATQNLVMRLGRSVVARLNIAGDRGGKEA